jgi:hypothetical protein
VKSTVLIAVSGMSLLANLWLGWLTWRPAGEPPSAAPVTLTARRIPTPAVTSAATRLPPGSVVEPPPDAFTLLTRLRDGRFPNSVLRAAANHLLLAHTPGLQQRLLIASPAFWREPPEGDAAMVATRAAAETELRKACDALLAELALPPDDNELAALALRFGPLPPDRARQLDALVRSMPEDRRRRELAQVLSPDELFECEVRSSPAAPATKPPTRRCRRSNANFPARFWCNHWRTICAAALATPAPGCYRRCGLCGWIANSPRRHRQRHFRVSAVSENP